MKKLLIILLSLTLILAFAGCGEHSMIADQSDSIFGGLSLNGMSENEFNIWYEAFMVPQGKPEGTAVYYDDLNSMLLSLDKGDIDYFLIPECTANYIMAANPDAYQVQLHDSVYFSMAVSADNTALLEKLNTALDALQADGSLDALRAQYLENCDPAAMPQPAELPVIDGGETVRVVVTGDMPPMDYMTADGQAAGYNVALLSAIGETARINFELVSANSASRALMLSSGKADAVFWCYGFDEEISDAAGDLTQNMTATRIYYAGKLADLRLK